MGETSNDAILLDHARAIALRHVVVDSMIRPAARLTDRYVARTLRIEEEDASKVMEFVDVTDSVVQTAAAFRESIRSNESLRNVRTMTNEEIAEELSAAHLQSKIPWAEAFGSLMRKLSDTGKMRLDQLLQHSAHDSTDFLSQLNDYRDIWVETIESMISGTGSENKGSESMFGINFGFSD